PSRVDVLALCTLSPFFGVVCQADQVRLILEALVYSLFRNQPHGLQELPTRLRATQQSHMLGPALGEGLPASHLGVPTTLRAKNGYQGRVLCHGSTPSHLCLGGSAVSDSEGIRRVILGGGIIP